MVRFPSGLYSDIRIEEVWSTVAGLVVGRLEQFVSRHYRAAFVRVWDGRRWYYSSTSDTSALQSELDSLAAMASPSPGIASDPLVVRMQANTGRHLSFDGRHVAAVPREAKLERLEASASPLRDAEGVVSWRVYYVDSHRRKTFASSVGADLEHDYQIANLTAAFDMAHGDSRLSESRQVSAGTFEELDDLVPLLSERLEKAGTFVREAGPVEGGRMDVILSPMATGIFAHESFGHKSEADFMLGDEAMLREWSLGKPVGRPFLSIVDDGRIPGSGFVPFDDEGTGAEETWLIRDGVLSGRLHSVETAAKLGEAPTGNCRSISFEYQPIPRMTTTHILPGGDTFGDLVAGVDRGVFVDTVKHGSGLSTFTLAPSMSYLVRNGRLAGPVNVSVVSGSVMETLGMIDGLSAERELFSTAMGGCGKGEQHPLPVSFGGPFIRVRDMEVR